MPAPLRPRTTTVSPGRTATSTASKVQAARRAYRNQTRSKRTAQSLPYGRSPRECPGGFLRSVGDQASDPPSRTFLVMFGSTGTPGPMVVETVTFLRYLPFAADGLARSTSSSTAA